MNLTPTPIPAPTHRLTSKIIATEAQLRALIGEPSALTCAKVSDRLNAVTRQFIERSPFVCIATSGPGGNCDLSPRGEPAGFVRIPDDNTLLVPERPGSRQKAGGWQTRGATYWPIRTLACCSSCQA